MQFTYTNEDGTKEDVQLEEWVWMAINKDGSFMKQYDEETKEFHRFSEINLDELDVFVVLNTQHTNDPKYRYEVHMEEGMTPIFFIRTTVFNMKEPGEVKVRMPHFGYKENINGQSRKTIMTVFPNGAVAVRNSDGREHLE
jgi:hypothetical protein